MKIYKLSKVDQKTIKWVCPVTGHYILGHFIEDYVTGYDVYDKDGSFYDHFENFFHASNWIRKHVDKDFKVPYTGMRIAGLNKTAFLDGEWWIIDGTAHFADGDVGDFNHEAYVIQHAQYLLMDGEEDWESWKISKAMETYEEIKDDYSEEEAYEMMNEVENDPENFIANHIDEVGLDSDTFFIANGNYSQDPREWSMKKFGWKRMAGNNITTWTLSSSDLESIKRGIWDAFEPEQLENEVFNIEVMSNKKMFWRVPMDVIESGNMNFYMDRSEWGVMANSGKFKIYRKANNNSISYMSVQDIQDGGFDDLDECDGMDSEDCIPENIDLDSGLANLESSSSINVLRGKEASIVAISNNMIVGALYEEFSNNEYSFDVIVLPEFQRKGIAKQLINDALSHFYSYEEMGAVMRLDVVNSNLEKYLKSIGLKEIDRTDGHVIMGGLYNKRMYRKASRTIKAYHGSSNTFKRFNSKYSAQGVFWFTEDINKIKEGTSGAASSKYIAEVELTVDKTAGWEEYEKLCLFQIENDGFDSIKLDDDWIIFDNNRIKILRWLKNELV